MKRYGSWLISQKMRQTIDLHNRKRGDKSRFKRICHTCRSDQWECEAKWPHLTSLSIQMVAVSISFRLVHANVPIWKKIQTIFIATARSFSKPMRWLNLALAGLKAMPTREKAMESGQKHWNKLQNDSLPATQCSANEIFIWQNLNQLCLFWYANWERIQICAVVYMALYSIRVW